MFNSYETEKLGEIRCEQMREAAKRARDIEAVKRSRPTVMAWLLASSGDMLIILGLRMKSWVTVEGVAVRRYGLDV